MHRKLWLLPMTALLVAMLAFGAACGDDDDGDDDALNGVCYFYQITALNGFREGVRSPEVNATPVGPPSAPAAVSALAAAGRVTLTWGDPEDNGGLAVTGFRIYRSDAGAPALLLAAPTSGGGYEDSGLTNGLAYAYSLSALNAAGEGPRSGPVEALPVGPPPEPRALNATPAASRVSLSWQAPVTSGGSPVTGYNLYRASAGGALVLLASLGDTLAFEDEGLTNGQTYEYALRAVNEHGPGDSTSRVAARPVGPPGAPSIEEIAAGRGEVRVRWASPLDTGGLPVTGFAVYRRTAGGNATLLATLPLQLEFTDGGLAYDQSYYYQVSAVNAIGEGPRSSVSGATLGAAPDSVKPTVAILEPAHGSAVLSGRVRFAGTASDNIALLKVEVSTDGVSWTAVAAVPRALSAGVEWTADIAVPAGTRALFVRATDASGSGNTGAVGTATWTTQGKFGNALSFNGTSAEVTVADSPSLRLTSGMTLEAWVNPSVVSNAWRDVMVKGNDDYYLMATSGQNSRPAGAVTIGGSKKRAFGTSALPLNTWTHLATTYDGTAVRLFVNGVQVASTTATGTIATSASALQIGGDALFAQFFSGRIDEVRIYNAALSAAQIQADMTAPI